MKNKRLIIAAAILVVLVVAFIWGSPKEVVPMDSDVVANEDLPEDNQDTPIENEEPVPVEEEDKVEPEEEPEHEEEPTKTDKKDKYQTDPVPEGKPEPKEPEHKEVIKEKELTVTLTVTAKTILNNLDLFNEEKIELLPEDGIIYPNTTVTFYEGESVIDVLLREMKNNKIHMEFIMTPIYNSHYIEGINNIYEFDCGELSGWMYKVNSWFPNYGMSRYKLEDGDEIELIYTCDLGKDIGNEGGVMGGAEE